ncbi:MAG: dCTP deaminase domain-containing protein [Thermoplasmata archaeon]
MILCDRDILDEIKKGNIIINPFDESKLTPNGYDLSIGEIMVSGSTYERYKLKRGDFFLISTMEHVYFGSDFAGHMYIKSRWSRKGIFYSFGYIDNGFNGNLTLSFYSAMNDVEIAHGMAFVQLVIDKLSNVPEKNYKIRSGNFQNSKGIMVEPQK